MIDKLRVLDLFAGIGGFSLGLERTGGFETVAFCEIDSFCQAVLAKHWPGVPIIGDIRDVRRDTVPTVDVITGGFPCQPFSVAGNRRGQDDDRNLWPEMRRVIEEVRPTWVIAENVPGIANLYLDTVLADLEDAGYSCGTIDLPAVAFGAPHIRHRLFVIAYADQYRRLRPKAKQKSTPNQKSDVAAYEPTRGTKFHEVIAGSQAATHANGRGRQEQSDERPCEVTVFQWPHTGHGSTRIGRANQWDIEPDVGRVADGVPQRTHRLRALGNAVVPRAVQYIGECLLEFEEAHL